MNTCSVCCKPFRSPQPDADLCSGRCQRARELGGESSKAFTAPEPARDDFGARADQIHAAGIAELREIKRLALASDDVTIEQAEGQAKAAADRTLAAFADLGIEIAISAQPLK